MEDKRNELNWKKKRDHEFEGELDMVIGKFG